VAEVIAAEGLVKRFWNRLGPLRRVEIHAVNGVDLGVNAGDSIGVVGESGCGKSTLARMMVGLEHPTEGVVRFEGDAVVDADGWRRLRRAVQYVFQDPYGSLPPKMSVESVLTDPLRINKIGDTRSQAERVRRYVELVGLVPSDLYRYPAEFSGGQRQRISIARALVLEPKVVLFDETTSGLDVSIQAQVLNLLVELQERLGIGWLFISHDLRVIRYLSRDVAVMYLGLIVERGPAEDVFEQPLHPYTRGLLDSMPDHRRVEVGLTRRPLARIAGEPPSALDETVGCPFAPRCPIAQDVCREVAPDEQAVAGRTVRCHFPGAFA